MIFEPSDSSLASKHRNSVTPAQNWKKKFLKTEVEHTSRLKIGEISLQGFLDKD